LTPQVKQAGDLVELIVSDNHSEDHTREVVEWAAAFGPVRYHRHPRNIGSMRNVYALVNDLARGEFVWVIGNDDIAREDALQRVIAVLQEHPELDYIYVNYSPWYPPAEDPTRIILANEFPDLAPGNPDLQDRYLERLGELAVGDPARFTPFYASVMRRSLARTTYEMCVHGEAWESIQNAVPQAVIVARDLLDKPAWYIGHPCVVTSHTTSWTDHRPVYFLIIVPDLYDYFERAGVARAAVDVHRRRMLLHGGTLESVLKVLTRPDVPMPGSFSLWGYIRRNRRFKEVWVLLWMICKGLIYTRMASLPQPAFNTLRWIWRKLRRPFVTVPNNST